MKRSFEGFQDDESDAASDSSDDLIIVDDEGWSGERLRESTRPTSVSSELKAAVKMQKASPITPFKAGKTEKRVKTQEGGASKSRSSPQQASSGSGSKRQRKEAGAMDVSEWLKGIEEVADLVSRSVSVA